MNHLKQIVVTVVALFICYTQYAQRHELWVSGENSLLLTCIPANSMKIFQEAIKAGKYPMLVLFNGDKIVIAWVYTGDYDSLYNEEIINPYAKDKLTPILIKDNFISTPKQIISRNGIKYSGNDVIIDVKLFQRRNAKKAKAINRILRKNPINS